MVDKLRCIGKPQGILPYMEEPIAAWKKYMEQLVRLKFRVA